MNGSAGLYKSVSLGPERGICAKSRAIGDKAETGLHRGATGLRSTPGHRNLRRVIPMTIQTRNNNTDRASVIFHVLTIALFGIFTIGAVLQLASQLA